MRVFFLNEINKYDSIGIQILSSVLKLQGHQTRVFLVPDLISNTTISLEFLKLARAFFSVDDEKYVDYLLLQNPGVIAFSAVTSYFQRCARFARIIKKKRPDVITIIGGPHIITTTKYLHEAPEFDYFCRGEGEKVLPQLIDELARKNYDPTLRGIYYIRNGRLIGNGMAEIIEQLDTIPFQDKEDVYRDYPYLSRLYTVNSLRTCPYSCTYCGSPLYRNEYGKQGVRVLRRRSVDNLMKELIEAKKKYGLMRKVGFTDDTFTLGKEWISDLCKEYKKHIRYPFYMCTNPILFTDPDMIQKLGEAGLTYTEIGVQTLDEEYRIKVIKRPDKDWHIFASANAMRKNNIYFQVNHIFGLDRRDYVDHNFLKKTVEYYLRVKPNRCHCFELEFLPGAKVAEIAIEEGILQKEDYEQILRGLSPASYNFGGSIKTVKIFKPYIVLLELMPFVPEFFIRWCLKSKFLFSLIKLIPMKYIVLARILNTIKDRRDIEGMPHYRKYLEGMLRVLSIKRDLWMASRGDDKQDPDKHHGNRATVLSLKRPGKTGTLAASSNKFKGEYQCLS